MSDPAGISSSGKPVGPALCEGTLKTGGTYSVHILGAEWLDDIQSLHDRVSCGLPDAKKSDVLPKTREFFEQHLKDGGVIVGAVSNGRLIGKGLMREPTAQNPESGMVDMAGGPPAERTAYFQSDTVDPAFQGHGVVQKLTQARLALAMLRGREYVCAEASVGNAPCLQAFFNCGFSVDSVGTDAADGTKVYNLCETTERAMLRTAFNAAAARKDLQAIDMGDVDKIAAKLSQGYRGVGMDRKTGTMLFAPKNQG